ncbi:class I SAM-dependent methyltransferase [Flavobacteriaceae bacterium]|nr:class I SAM-dependent methyltransferase [Flavobacteriaceae bacterium]
MESKKRVKKPWPTKDAMNQVYELHLWGGNSHDFYSGEGSYDSNIITPYIKEVSGFLKLFPNKLTVCDLGCGDFNVGKNLIDFAETYTAVDIVDKLITRNKDKFKADNLKFECLDIAEDVLPQADCIIVRQVLQHLSNKEVEKVVSKLSAYKYIVLTEHLPNGQFKPNKDIISGQGIRIKKGSGLVITEPPFNFKAKEIKEMVVHNLDSDKGIIKTTLYTL